MCGTFITTNKPVRKYYDWLKRPLQTASVFNCHPFSVPGSHPGHHMTLSHQGSEGFSQLTWFLSLPLLLVASLKRKGQLHGGDGSTCRKSLHWDFSDVFLIARLALQIFRRKTTEAKCYSPDLLSRVHGINSIYHYRCELSWPRRGRWCHTAISFAPFLHHALQKSVTRYWPYLRGEELCFTSLMVEYLQKSSGILLSERLTFLPIYLFNHLLTSVWTHGCLFDALGYNPLLFYCAQIIPVLVTGNSLRRLLFPWDVPPLLWGFLWTLLSVTRFYKFIFCISGSSPTINLVIKKPCLFFGFCFLLEDGIRNQGLEIRCVHYGWSAISRPSHLTQQGNICVYSNLCVQICLDGSICVYIKLNMSSFWCLWL